VCDLWMSGHVQRKLASFSLHTTAPTSKEIKRRAVATSKSHIQKLPYSC
jgi:hypothetical protein